MSMRKLVIPKFLQVSYTFSRDSAIEASWAQWFTRNS